MVVWNKIWIFRILVQSLMIVVWIKCLASKNMSPMSWWNVYVNQAVNVLVYYFNVLIKCFCESSCQCFRTLVQCFNKMFMWIKLSMF